MIKPKLNMRFWYENAKIQEDLARQRFNDSEKRFCGLMAYHSQRGDAFHFTNSTVAGRMTYAQESGVLCNLDR